MKNEDGLTLRQQRFCLEFMRDFNQKQAAIRAGYSSKTAEQQASRLLRNVKVYRYLEELRAELVDTAKLSALRVIMETERIAFSSLGQFLDGDRVRNPGELLPEALAAVQKIKPIAVLSGDGKSLLKVLYEYELHPKVSALHQLHKILGSYAETKLRIKGAGGAEVDIFRHADRSKLQASYEKYKNGPIGSRDLSDDELEVKRKKEELQAEINRARELNMEKERLLQTVQKKLAEDDRE